MKVKIELSCKSSLGFRGGIWVVEREPRSKGTNFLVVVLNFLMCEF